MESIHCYLVCFFIKGTVQRELKQCCEAESGIRCFFNLCIRDPGCKKNPDPDPGSEIGIPDHITESLKTIFGLKILKFFNADPDPGSGIFLTLDPGSGIFLTLYPGSRIRNTGSKLRIVVKKTSHSESSCYFKKISIPVLHFDREFKLHPTPTYYHGLELKSTFLHSQSRICIAELKIIILWVYGY